MRKTVNVSDIWEMIGDELHQAYKAKYNGDDRMFQVCYQRASVLKCLLDLKATSAQGKGLRDAWEVIDKGWDKIESRIWNEEFNNWVQRTTEQLATSEG